MAQSQALTNIINMNVSVSPTLTQNYGFDLGLIVGTSNVISTVQRVQLFNTLGDMETAGFATTSPEYQAADIYFSQTPTPTNVLIGRQGTASTTLASALTSGTAYTTLDVAALATGEAIAAGDTLTLTSGTNTQTVTATIAASAGATTISVQSFTPNFSYPVGTTVSGAETVVAAVTACRNASAAWYPVFVCETADTDITATAAYIEAAAPPSTFFYVTNDPAVTSGTAGNVMETLQLQANNYQRTIGQWSNTSNAIVAMMGYAMGANTNSENAAYTLAYKSEIGVTPDSFTTQEFSTVTGYNGNVYTTFGNGFQLFYSGKMANGTPFDQVLNVDQLSSNIQNNVINLLAAVRKIPLTDAGVAQVVLAIASACEEAKTKDVIGPGIWQAAAVSKLQTGASMPDGYVIMADPVSTLTETQRQQRQLPNIYVCVKLTGAVEHGVLTVVVNA